MPHFFILLVFLTKFPNATPIEFLYFQLSKLVGQDCVKVIFDHLLNLTFQACEYLARSIRVKIAEIFNKMGKLPTILLAVDEIVGAAASGHDYLSRNDKQDRCRFSKLWVIICGTGSSYDRAPSVTSDIGKGTIEIIPELPLASEDDVYSSLKKIPGVDVLMILKEYLKVTWYLIYPIFYFFPV